MNIDRMKSLIGKADAGIPPPGICPTELSRLVRLHYQRRQKRRLTALTMAVLLLGIFMGWEISMQRRESRRNDLARNQSNPEKEFIGQSANFEEINRQINLHERLLERLLVAERYYRQKAETDRWLSKSTGKEYIEGQISIAAATILVTADHERQNFKDHESARKGYNLIVELFPQTIWADQAKQRLAALTP
jgi:hypothetical protein